MLTVGTWRPLPSCPGRVGTAPCTRGTRAEAADAAPRIGAADKARPVLLTAVAPTEPATLKKRKQILSDSPTAKRITQAWQGHTL